MAQCGNYTCPSSGGNLINQSNRDCVGDPCLVKECCFNNVIPSDWPKDSDNGFTVDLDDTSVLFSPPEYDDIKAKCTGEWTPVDGDGGEVAHPICYENNYIKSTEVSGDFADNDKRKLKFENQSPGNDPCWKMFKYIPKRNDYLSSADECPLGENKTFINYRNCNDEPGPNSGCGICKDHCFRNAPGGALWEDRERRETNSCVTFDPQIEYGLVENPCTYNVGGLSVDIGSVGCVNKDLIVGRESIQKRLPACRIKSETGEDKGSCIEGKCWNNNSAEVCEKKRINYSQWLWREDWLGWKPNTSYWDWKSYLFILVWVISLAVCLLRFHKTQTEQVAVVGGFWGRSFGFILILAAFLSTLWWWFWNPAPPCKTDTCGEDCITVLSSIFALSVICYFLWLFIGGGKKKPTANHPPRGRRGSGSSKY